MSADLMPSAGDLIRILPEIVLTVMGTLLMVLDPLLHKRSSNAFGHLSLAALIAALGATVYAYANEGPAFGGMIVVDGFATFFRALVIVVGILTVLSSYRFLRRQDAETSAYHALLLFSIAGQSMMAASGNLIVVFIALEISSISSYVLTGYLRDDPRSNEAALKYFLLGSFATAFFLYGVALIYGGPLPPASPDLSPRPCSWVWRRRCYSWGWGSRCPPRRSRSGRRTSTRARLRRSPRSFRPAPKPRPSPCFCASS
jgi:NADH-quinone oxidoreductase subunit N